MFLPEQITVLTQSLTVNTSYLETLQLENHLECVDLYSLVFKFYFEWLINNVIQAVECCTEFTM